MKTIYVMDVLNVITPYELVRYFKKFNKVYLIYTKGERVHEDDNVYVKNYVVVKNNEDMWVAPDDDDWNDFKKFVKKISNESSLGAVTTVDDIEMRDRTSIRVITNRMFKVVPYYYHLLSQNHNYHTTLSVQMSNKTTNLNQQLIHQFEIGTLNMPDIDYVEEYQKLKQENDYLYKKLKEIETIVNQNSNKLDS